MPSKKRKLPAGTTPRYVEAVTRNSRAEFVDKHHRSNSSWNCFPVPVPGTGDRCLVSQDLQIDASGISNRFVTQGSVLLVACSGGAITREEYLALEEPERWRCVYYDDEYFYASRDPHAVADDGSNLYWATPGGLLEAAPGPVRTNDAGDSLCTATGEFFVVSEEDAEAYAQKFAREHGATLGFRVWYRTWRPLAKGVRLTYEQEEPDGLPAPGEEKEPEPPEVEQPEVASVASATVSEASTSKVAELERKLAEQQALMDARMAEQGAQIAALLKALGTSASASSGVA